MRGALRGPPHPACPANHWPHQGAQGAVLTALWPPRTLAPQPGWMTALTWTSAPQPGWGGRGGGGRALPHCPMTLTGPPAAPPARTLPTAPCCLGGDPWHPMAHTVSAACTPCPPETPWRPPTSAPKDPQCSLPPQSPLLTPPPVPFVPLKLPTKPPPPVSPAGPLPLCYTPSAPPSTPGCPLLKNSHHHCWTPSK